MYLATTDICMLTVCCVMQSRTDCGPSEDTTAEERDAISVRLTRILTAYAYSDPAVGYCQGKPRFSISLNPALPSISHCCAPNNGLLSALHRKHCSETHHTRVTIASLHSEKTAVISHNKAIVVSFSKTLHCGTLSSICYAGLSFSESSMDITVKLQPNNG